MKIALDFDGTCVRHKYPDVGSDCTDVLESLQALINDGDELILFTMRSGVQLDDAVKWFKDRDIKLHGVQYSPGQTLWTSSNKCYAELYIDDAALGAPLIWPEHERPFIDWLTTMRWIKRIKEIAGRMAT